jgi:copper resistance protein C
VTIRKLVTLVTALGAILVSGVDGDRVVTTTPADGAVLAAPPAEVELALSNAADVGESHVTVRDASGTTMNAGGLHASSHDRLRQPVAIASTGAYEVVYHIVFANGHSAIGTIRFGVGSKVDDVPAGAEPHAHGEIDPMGAGLLVADGVVLAAVSVLLLRRRYRVK